MSSALCLKLRLFARRWMKKYFTLSHGCIEYFDDVHSKHGKKFELSGASVVKYLARDRCIAIKNITRNHQLVDSLILMAENLK
jgi:hypothetical protein